jgi:hypothetical protein
MELRVLPPPFLKQRYGKCQTFTKPTDKIIIEIHYKFQEYKLTKCY